MLVFCDMTLLLVTIYYKMLVVCAMTVIVNHLPEDASLLRYEIVSLVTIYQMVLVFCDGTVSLITIYQKMLVL